MGHRWSIWHALTSSTVELGKRALATHISRGNCAAWNWFWLALLAGACVGCFAESGKKSAHMDAVGGMDWRHPVEHMGARDSNETLHLLAILNPANLNGSPESELDTLVGAAGLVAGRGTRCKRGGCDGRTQEPRKEGESL